MTVAPAPALPAPVVAASPYPWPYHGRLAPARTALVCCLDERWREASAAGAEADARLGGLARRLSALGGLVVAVTAAPDGRGRALPVRADVVVEAAGTSGFFGSRLDAALRDAARTDLILAGWGLEGPVHSTLRAANDRGFECLLVPDACTAVDEALVDGACSTVRMSGGIFGAVAPTGRVLEALGVVPGTANDKAGDDTANDEKVNDERTPS